MNDNGKIVLRKVAEKWEAFDHVVGPTDVHWYGWIDQYGLLEALFPPI